MSCAKLVHFCRFKKTRSEENATMLAVRYLRFQLSCAGAVSSTGNIPCFEKISYFHSRLNLRSVKSQLLYSVPRFSSGKLVSQKVRQYAKKMYNSGRDLSIRSMVFCSTIGLVGLWPRLAYCADGFNLYADHHQTNLWPAPRSERGLRLTILMQKLIQPLFLLLFVWLNWGRLNVLDLTARVVVYLICAKPLPSSVHIFVDQLQRKIMSQQPLLYLLMPLHEYKVEFEDYILVWIARVRVKDEKLVLIGFLGSWWISPLSSWEELTFSFKSRFRIAANMGIS